MPTLNRLMPLALAAALLTPPMARAAPLQLAFLPPQVGEQSLCGAPRDEITQDLPGPGDRKSVV